MSPHFLSIPFAIVVKSEKLQSSHALTIFEPEAGLRRFFYYKSKKTFVQNLQELNLVEIVVQNPSSKNPPRITDLSSLFSFSPPYMQFFHFFAVQSLISKNLTLLFSYTSHPETSKIFLLFLTCLQQSSSISSVKESYAFLLSFFWKWMGITSFHNDIFHCQSCQSRLIHNPYTPSILWTYQKKLLCDNCKKKYEFSSATKVSNGIQYQFYLLLYAPLREISQTSFQISVLHFVNRDLESFLYFSPKMALLKKNNPFVNL